MMEYLSGFGQIKFRQGIGRTGKRDPRCSNPRPSHTTPQRGEDSLLHLCDPLSPSRHRDGLHFPPPLPFEVTHCRMTCSSQQMRVKVTCVISGQRLRDPLQLCRFVSLPGAKELATLRRDALPSAWVTRMMWSRAPR